MWTTVRINDSLHNMGYCYDEWKLTDATERSNDSWHELQIGWMALDISNWWIQCFLTWATVAIKHC